MAPLMAICVQREAAAGDERSLLVSYLHLTSCHLSHRPDDAGDTLQIQRAPPSAADVVILCQKLQLGDCGGVVRQSKSHYVAAGDNPDSSSGRRRPGTSWRRKHRKQFRH